MEFQDTHSLIAQLNSEAAELGMRPTMADTPSSYQISQRRRRGRIGAIEDPLRTVSLVLDSQDRLVWHEGARPRSHDGRRGRRGVVAPGQVIDQYTFEPLGPNEVVEFLSKLDVKLTPHQGLRKWVGNAWHRVDKPVGTKRVLVLIHGTFSTGDRLMDELRSTSLGKDLIAKATLKYDEILSFDHPTLSVSPLINALNLASRFRGCSARVDVIAHSRGGLVARWWLDVLRQPTKAPCQAVLVGSPLGGTSLATPAALRSSLSLLTNYGRTLQMLGLPATTVAPFLAIPLGLLKVVTSITTLASKTPVLDAALALVPGLHAQSRAVNNHEMVSLKDAAINAGAEYAVIGSNFEPEDPAWKFWRRFRKSALTDSLADFVFDGNNDLVVDSASVEALPWRAADVCDYQTNGTVHHCNYFEQERTVQLIAKRLSLV